MKLIRIATLAATLCAGTTAFADTPAKTPAPAEKKAPPAPAKDDKAPAKTEITEAEAAKFVAFFDKLVDIIVVNKADCTKMAAGINGHVDANQDLLKQAAAYKAANKELPKAIKEKIEEKTMKVMAPAIQEKCAQDKTVMTALMRMKPKDTK